MTVVRSTQPLASGASLRSLAHNYRTDSELAAVAQAINGTTPLMPIDFSMATSCKWTPIAKLDPVQQAQMSVVEFSSPIPNPFIRSEFGILVRLSVGGHDAQWYWIPMAQRNGAWSFGVVMPMDLHES